jgi:hypothetical protein
VRKSLWLCGCVVVLERKRSLGWGLLWKESIKQQELDNEVDG